MNRYKSLYKESELISFKKINSVAESIAPKLWKYKSKQPKEKKRFSLGKVLSKDGFDFIVHFYDRWGSYSYGKELFIDLSNVDNLNELIHLIGHEIAHNYNDLTSQNYEAFGENEYYPYSYNLWRFETINHRDKKDFWDFMIKNGMEKPSNKFIKLFNKYYEGLPKELLLEFTLPEWTDKLGIPTKKSYLIRKQKKGNIERSLQFIDFDIDTGIAYFLVEPTHNFSTKSVDDRGVFRSDNSYEVQIEFLEWKDWVDDWKKMTLDEWRQLLRAADVKFHCTCPSFFYQGIRYTLTQVDSAIKPLNIPDPIWGPIMGKNLKPYTCKHLQSVIKKTMRYPQQVYNLIKRKAI